MKGKGYGVFVTLNTIRLAATEQVSGSNCSSGLGEACRFTAWSEQALRILRGFPEFPSN